MDAADADSAWGTFDLPLRRLGLLSPPAEAGPPEFIALQRGDSVIIRLGRRSTDVGVVLRGLNRPLRAGHWKAEQRAVQGRFRIAEPF